jgi:polyprenyl-phospho-N-acetylgalactosaminyl synthase
MSDPAGTHDSRAPDSEVLNSKAPDGRPHDTWVVIPLYNEGPVITDVIAQVRGAFDQVVCVDDGSSDDSAALAGRAGARVVRHPFNLGQGAALQTGFDYALSDPTMKYVVTFDADGQHQIADAIGMVERLRVGEADVVFGSRFLDERSSPTLGKRLVLRAAVGYTNLTTHTRLTDAHNGLRAISRPVLEQIRITQNGMAHASELVAQIGASKATYVEHPVHILYSDYSKAKGQSLWNSINILAELILR